MVRKIFFITTIGVLILLGSCQQYHDTTARFNAYFLANEKTLEVEETLFGNPENDYNDVLQVLAPIDTTAAAGQAASFEYIIEKASLPIQWHESSKWVDDCYNLIGKARLYQGDFMNAALTFKYVNKNSEDDNARHHALILLLRTFMASKQYENMFNVIDYIRKEKSPINEENTRLYHLTMGHYYRQVENYDMLTLHLAEALPFIYKRREKARLNFLMAQLLEMQGKEIQAFEHYDLAFKFSPTYELEFQADLKRSGVSEIDSEESIAEASKYFKKLLADEKNWEYRDKIYYEMAKYYLRIDNIDEALYLLNESIKVSSSNVVQKAYSYLKMGQLYYYDLQDYENAALYYDSTMQVMPTYIKNYEKNKELAETLKEFAKYHKQVKDQDRLLALSKMPQEELDEFLNIEMEKEKESILKVQENQKLNEENRKKAPSTTTDLNSKQDEGWYFYNTTAKVFGQTNFIRTWGDRPLEDNWRRSRRQRIFEDENPVVVNNNTQQKNAEEEKAEDNIFAGVKSIEQRKAEIPNTPDKLVAVRGKLEEGLFELGKVYYYRLEEFQNLIETYSRLHKEFPKGQYTVEAMYILYTMCGEYDGCNQLSYKDTIIQEFPSSFYAKILINPNYVEETNIYNQEATKSYENCFALYKNQNYSEADSLLQIAINNYPKSTVLDKMHLLRAMIDGKTTEDLTTYYLKLKAFIDRFKESELLPYAKDLQAAIKPNQIVLPNQKANSGTKGGAPSKNR